MSCTGSKSQLVFSPMMQFRARPFQTEDREGFNRVRSRVYRTGEAISPDENLIGEDATATVVELNGEIVGSATALDFNCTFFDSELRTAAVAAVGVVPEHRRSGAGGELMAYSHRHYRDLGFHAAVLYPFRGSYYRRFGYEYCGIKNKVTVRPGILPQLQGGLPIRELSQHDIGLLKPVYERFARSYNGMNLRNSAQWSRALGMDKPSTVYAAGDPIEAYAFVRLDGTFWIPQNIREFVWATRNGYLTMLSFFHSFLMNKSEVDWWEPLNSPLLGEFFDQSISCKAEGATMFRLLDVQESLSRCRPAGSGRFSLRVIDDHIPENEGPWRVEYSDGNVSVQPSNEADLTCSIGELTQLLLGWPGAAVMTAQGRLCVDSAGLADLQKFFRARDVYCLDWF